MAVVLIIIAVVMILRLMTGGAIHPAGGVTSGTTAAGIPMVHVEGVPAQVEASPRCIPIRGDAVAPLAFIPPMVAWGIVAVLAVRDPLVIKASTLPSSSRMAGRALPSEVVRLAV